MVAPALKRPCGSHIPIPLSQGKEKEDSSLNEFFRTLAPIPSESLDSPETIARRIRDVSKEQRFEQASVDAIFKKYLPPMFVYAPIFFQRRCFVVNVLTQLVP